VYAAKAPILGASVGRAVADRLATHNQGGQGLLSEIHRWRSVRPSRRSSCVSAALYPPLRFEQFTANTVGKKSEMMSVCRTNKYLLRGQLWVDASTFRIRRIEGVPAKSPSFWIKNVHITVQFAQLGNMWVPVSFEAVAAVRFLGQYTLAGLNIQSSESL
jgi:hypothetical protein